MTKNLFGTITAAVLLATPLASPATTFFADTFGSGSTLNAASPGTPTATATYYEVISGKPWNPLPSIAPGHLRFGITNTTGGTLEIQAQFPETPLTGVGGYIQLSVTFTDTQGLLNQNSFLGAGLYYSGGVAPIGGGLNGTASSAYSTAQTGGAQNWQGYVAIIGHAGLNSGFYDRQQQTTAGGNNNQDLVTTSSSSQSYQNPPAAVIGTASTAPSVTLAAGQQYTEILTYTLSASGALILTNQLYAGPDNTGTLLSTMTATTGTTPLSTVFDGFAFGVRSTGNLTNTLIDINSITVSGFGSPPPPPPETAPVVVATNGSCAFSVSVIGVGLTYQWHRNGTNLLDGGNISGSTSAMLIISPAGTNDAVSGTNGYYVTITDAGNYSINSTTNSLTLCPAANLVWSGGGSDWDVATSSNWLDGGVSAVFNYGDNVTFDDTASAGYTTVNLSGAYLSAGLVTVSNSVDYTLAGSGSIAGPGALLYEGSGHLTLSGVNSYSGATIVSNASAYLVLSNYSALGNGPVTFAKAGGTMEVVPAGSAITGIDGDVMVADDCTIQFDGLGTYAGVFLGNLSGTAGKTLTLVGNPGNSTTNCRVRIFGTNTAYDANLILNGSLLTLAAYGSQSFSGVISGSGAFMEKGTVARLNGNNTYTGGTSVSAGALGFGVDSTGSPTVTSGPIGTGPLLLTVDSTTLTTGNGQIFAADGARTIWNPVQNPTGTNNLTLTIGGTNNLTLAGPFTLNGNDNVTTNTITARIVQVTNTGLTTIAGVISDNTNGVSAGYGFIKSGNGVLALNNTGTYTGPTTVSNGTLQVNGQLNAPGAVTVSSSAMLAGTGTINGPVTVNAGGTLAPGTSPAIGTLAIGNNLTLNGDLFFKINKSLSPQSNDAVSVSGTLTNGGTGTLTITNLGPALAVGDRFRLFNPAVAGGDALIVTGGGPGVTWLNNLSTDGSLSVAATASFPGINITITNGTNVVFSGTGAPAGVNYWILFQTNLTRPLTDWIRMYTNTVPMGGVFSVTVTNACAPGDPNRFFIFSLPH